MILITDPDSIKTEKKSCRFLGEEGHDRHLLKFRGTGPKKNDTLDVTIVSTTDLGMLARVLRSNNYVFYYTEKRNLAHWDCYTGNKKCPNRGGILLKPSIIGETMQCYIVTRVKTKTLVAPS